MELAVITYIFGENKEILREPLVLDKNVEYICVTDQKNLSSKNWKIVFDKIKEANCTRDKMVYVKYNPFKYTNAEKICVIDGTIEICNHIDELFNKIDEYDILLKRHPKRTNLIDELNCWIEKRGMSKTAIDKFSIMSKKSNIDLKNDFLIETCIIVYKNTDKIKKFCNTEIAYMKFLGDNNLFLSNQCVLSFLIQQTDMKIGYVKQDSYFNRYGHNTNYKWID